MPNIRHHFIRRLFILSLRGTVLWRRSNPLFNEKIASSGVALLAMTLLLAACASLTGISATEPPQPSDTPPPTATIVWFPPSATPTPEALPTPTATPNMSPGIGAATLQDDFSDDKAWDTVNSDQASAILQNHHLILAVQPGVSVASLRRDVIFTDFYAEITVDIGLCRTDDTYGLLIRANGNSFYRYVFSCNGIVQVERIKSGTRILIANPIASGDVPPGAPGQVQIGLWAVGGEMRLFLNHHYQFTVNEKTFPSGAFGVFAQSKGDTPVTITFSNFNVYAVNYIPLTFTPAP